MRYGIGNYLLEDGQMGIFKLNSIKSKMIMISILILVVPLTILGVFSYGKSKDSLNVLGETNLKNSVEMTLEMIEALNEEMENGDLSLEQAQERVKEAVLRDMKEDGTRPINDNIDLGENGYIFILADDGLQIAHPKLEGDNSWDSEDPNGIMSTQELIKTSNEGGGFTYFDWPLPHDESKIEPKVSYSKKDPNWDWNIVAGTYMMDFNKPAQEVLALIIAVSVGALVLGILIIWVVVSRIAKPIN